MNKQNCCVFWLPLSRATICISDWELVLCWTPFLAHLWALGLRGSVVNLLFHLRNKIEIYIRCIDVVLLAHTELKQYSQLSNLSYIINNKSVHNILKIDFLLCAKRKYHLLCMHL